MSRVSHGARDRVPGRAGNQSWTVNRGRWHSRCRWHWTSSKATHCAINSQSLSCPPPCILCSLIDGQSSLLSHLQIQSDRACSRRMHRPERVTKYTYDANTEFSDVSMGASTEFYMDDAFPRGALVLPCSRRLGAPGGLRVQAGSWPLLGRWRHQLLRAAVQGKAIRRGERHSVHLVLVSEAHLPPCRQAAGL